MGQDALITAKNKSNEHLNLLNQDLKNSGFTKTSFVTEEKILDWFKYQQTCKDDYIRINYVDDKGNFTLDSYKKYLKIWNLEAGKLVFDYAFGRTSSRQLEKVARFIYDRKEFLEPVVGMSDILERGEAPKYIKEALQDFQHIEPEPEKLPKKEQYHPDLQGGNMLCKSFSIEPFWVVFGKVDEPKFMTVRIYEDEIMNNIYRDKKGLSYLLIPLMTLDGKKFGSLTRDEFFTRAWNMGLREHPNMFFPLVYKFQLKETSKKFFQEVANEFSAHYTPEELLERYEIIKQAKELNKYNPAKEIVQLDEILKLIPSVKDSIK